MTKATVTQLAIYPVKGCKVVYLDRMNVISTGPQYDRQWMIIDENGKFVSQRTHTKLALIYACVKEDDLFINIPGCGAILIIPTTEGSVIEATVHQTVIQTVEQSKKASHALSEYLGCAVKLVGFAKSFVRHVNPKYALNEYDHTLFADGFPFLLISEESLNDLNSRLEVNVPMNRFRPNIVIKGLGAYAEDQPLRFRINDVIFRGVKQCSRCTVTTVDQDTGIKGKDPLKTLASYRNSEKGIMFGMNVIHETVGFICVGDEVEVLS